MLWPRGIQPKVLGLLQPVLKAGPPLPFRRSWTGRNGRPHFARPTELRRSGKVILTRLMRGPCRGSNSQVSVPGLPGGSGGSPAIPSSYDGSASRREHPHVGLLPEFVAHRNRLVVSPLIEILIDVRRAQDRPDPRDMAKRNPVDRCPYNRPRA